MALGALIIQTKFQYSIRELVKQIAENPYLQYFIGLPGYQEQTLPKMGRIQKRDWGIREP